MIRVITTVTFFTFSHNALVGWIPHDNYISSDVAGVTAGFRCQGRMPLLIVSMNGSFTIISPQVDESKLKLVDGNSIFVLDKQTYAYGLARNGLQQLLRGVTLVLRAVNISGYDTYRSVSLAGFTRAYRKAGLSC